MVIVATPRPIFRKNKCALKFQYFLSVRIRLTLVLKSELKGGSLWISRGCFPKFANGLNIKISIVQNEY